MATAASSSPKLSPQALKGLLLVTIRLARFVASAEGPGALEDGVTQT